MSPGEATLYSTSFAKGMDDTQKRIFKCYSDLNLDLLDEDSYEDVPALSVPAPEARAAESEGVTSTPPA